MDFYKAQESIINWIKDFLEKPNENLNGFPPCPYARQARLNNAIMFCEGSMVNDDFIDFDLTSYEVAVVIYDKDHYTGEAFERALDFVNKKYLKERDLIALPDHPDNVEVVKGVSMNQGEYALAIVGRISDLNERSKQLYKKGYYEGWDKDYLTEVFKGRQDPRQS